MKLFERLYKKVIKKSQSPIVRGIFFVVVLYFTFVLRAHNYERVPTANHLDEMLYAWSGIYLVETGVPVSWSTLEYPDRAEVYRGRISYKGGIPETQVRLYRPWLDEPPLFSLLVGYFAHIFGALRTDFIPASYIRFPIIFISTFTSIFIFLIGRKISGFWTGLLAMLIYGTTPIMVFASRTAMPENLIALLLTAIIYIFLKFAEKPGWKWVIPLPLMIGIAGLSKPTGYFLLPLCLFFVFLIYYQKKQIKKAVYSCLGLILGTLPFIGAFYAYGLHYDPAIFWRITEIQSHRPAGFGSLAWYFITPSYDTVVLRDSWYVFSLLSAAFFIFKSKLNFKNFESVEFRSSVIILAFVYWVMIVMISGGENDLLAWYRFPTFPALAILGAWGVKWIVAKADFLATFVAAGMLLGNRMLLVNAFHPNVDAIKYRLILSGLMFPSLLSLIFDKKNLQLICRSIIIGIMAIGIYFNTIYIYNAFDIACEAKTCPIVPSTKLSELNFPIIRRLIEMGPNK